MKGQFNSNGKEEGYGITIWNKNDDENGHTYEVNKLVNRDYLKMVKEVVLVYIIGQTVINMK
jgi:hypothetical protein